VVISATYELEPHGSAARRAAVGGEGAVHFADVTGPTASLLDRAARAVALGARGLDTVLALRRAGLGVPILAHRVGSGSWARSGFGASGAVLALLARLCGADLAVAGGFGGTLFDTDGEMRAAVEPLRRPAGGAAASCALPGGRTGPGDVGRQGAGAAGGGVVVVLGSRACHHPAGLGAAVAEAVAATA
jgi:ribulose 1,5-bisphosphate carboxylase large subunit-like protein